MIPIIIRTKSSTYKHNLPYKQRQQKAVSQPFTMLPSLQSRPGDTRSLPPSMVRQCTTDLGNMIVSTCPAAPPEVADCNQAYPQKPSYYISTNINWTFLTLTVSHNHAKWHRLVWRLSTPPHKHSYMKWLSTLKFHNVAFSHVDTMQAEKNWLILYDCPVSLTESHCQCQPLEQTKAHNTWFLRHWACKRDLWWWSYGCTERHQYLTCGLQKLKGEWFSR
jgi:hypothetical protein